MTSKLEIICQSANIKMTPQRKVIAEAISNSSDHPDVEEIYKRANLIDSNISLATVYRTVSLLELHNLIKKLEIGDGKARYEANYSNTKHHHHLIDIETGKILEFADEELEKLKEKIAKKLGYELIDHRLELYGKKIKP
ncbi:MAG: transcriptional repressor [Candidatus Midichloria sp.]|nr:MAG: transcriptional repressor [Candidatus Midichloria sp.]